MMNLSKTCLFLVLPLSMAWACGSSSDTGNSSNTGASSGSGAAAGTLNVAGDGVGVGGDGTGTSTGGSINGTGGSINGTGGTGGTVNGTGGGVVATGTTACSDGKDNDGDGLIDGFDPECTGADDNDESTFATGIPGDNRDPKWQDCFFDGNSGAGNDGCRYATGCLTGELPPTDQDCKLTAACIKFCAPLVPNGCDCFGCCTVQLPAGGSADIQTVGTCSIDKIGDAKACPTCVKSDACGNTCGHCELCAGKTIADLPADCAPTGTGGSGSGTGGSGSGTTGGSGGSSGPSYTCDGGEPVCGPGLAACGIGTYCSYGCCIAKPPR